MGDNETHYSNNPRPSSTRYCRPTKFEFVKETSTVIKAEVARVKAEIETSRCVSTEAKGRTFLVNFSILLSMMDGKVLQYINEVPSSLTCPICGANPSDMNNIELILERIPSGHYSAMSPLHARIKFMECVLKISYCLPYRDHSRY